MLCLALCEVPNQKCRIDADFNPSWASIRGPRAIGDHEVFTMRCKPEYELSEQLAYREHRDWPNTR